MAYNKLNRRKFMKESGKAALVTFGFPYIIWSSALGKAGTIAPSNRINMGFIGVGGRGMALLTNFINLKDSNVIAVCDVQKPCIEKAKKYIYHTYSPKVYAKSLAFIKSL